jgi:hypothetical protein
MKRHPGLAALALTLSFLTPWCIRAQTPERHGPTEDDRNQSHARIDLEGTDFNQALQQRFNGLRMSAEERERWMQNAKKMADKILKNPKDPEILKDPEFQKMAKELLQNQHAGDWLQEELKKQKNVLPPEKFKEYEQTLKRLQKEAGAERMTGFSKDGRRYPGPAGRETGKAANEPEDGGVNDREPPFRRRPGSPDSEKTDTPGEKSSGSNKQERMMQERMAASRSPIRPGGPPPSANDHPMPEEKWARLLKNLNIDKKPLAESPAVQEVLRQMRRARSSPEPIAANDNSWVGQFARFSQSLTKNDVWSKMGLPNLGKWQPPVGQSLPKVHSPWSRSSFEGMPSVGMPSARSVDRGLQVLWVALIVAAGVLVWRLLGGSVPGMKRQAKRNWKLGPWPVAPGAVGTRQDLVRAFEHLSLLKLGPAAQSRNHLELAGELGEADTEHRRAARRLAALYEKARYTPANEALSADALASARRELCYLAGVKQA